jgi:hypothetical protein
VLDDGEDIVSQIRVVASRSQVQGLLRWAPVAERVWAVRNANGLGRLLAQQLVAHGESVIDVPATLAARARKLSGHSACKTDDFDARNVVELERKFIAREVVDDIRALDRRIPAANRRLSEALAAYGTTLTDIHGIGDVGAATILSIVDDPLRFPTRGHFAVWSSPLEQDTSDLLRVGRRCPAIRRLILTWAPGSKTSA